MGWIRTGALGVVALAAWASCASAQSISGSWLLVGTGSFDTAGNWSSNPSVPSGGSLQVLGFNGGYIGRSPFQPFPILSDIYLNTATQTWISIGPFQLTSGVIDNERVNNESIFNSAVPLAPRIQGITGSAGLIKNGAGAIYLNDISTFSGGVQVNGGTIAFANSYAFGVGNNITLNGGALAPTADVGTVTQAITLQGYNTLAGSATYSAGISGSGSLTLRGDNINFTAANTYSGGTTVRGSGTAGLTLSGNGSINNTSLLDINGRLTLNNSVTASSNRVSDTAEFNLSGILELIGNSSTAVNENIGYLAIGGGGNTIAITSGTTPTVLTASNIGRVNFGTLNVKAANLYSVTAPGASLVIAGIGNQLVGGSGAANSTRLKILPWGVEGSDVSNLRLLTANAGTNVVRPLTANEYETNLLNAAADVNVKLAGNNSIAAPTAVNALLNNGFALSGPGTLSVTSGLIAGGGTVSCPVDFGATDGKLLLANVTGPISGTGGVTFDRLGVPTAVTLNAANTYSGRTTVNGGTFILGASVLTKTPGPFGSDASTIYLAGGSSPVVLNSPTPITISRPLYIANFAQTNIANAPYLLGPITTTGTINLWGPMRVSNGFTATGPIVGLGSIIAMTGQASISLSGDNHYTGGTVLRNGTITLGSNYALGTGSLTINGTGTLLVTSSAVQFTPNDVFMDPAVNGATLAFAAKSLPQTLFSSVDLGTGSPHIAVLNASDSILETITNGTLNKDGPGRLSVGSLGVSGLNINAGTLQLTSFAGPSRVGALSMAAGTKFDLANSGLVITYGDSPTPIDAIRTLIQGGQILSSTSVAGVSTVGYADNLALQTRSFKNDLVGTHSLLLEKTYFGDANLDGSVNAADFVLLSNNFGSTAGRWTQGDFNYDGTVNAADFVLLSNNFGRRPAALDMTPADWASYHALAARLGLDESSVPEPAMLLAGAMGLLLQRRRRILPGSSRSI